MTAEQTAQLNFLFKGIASVKIGKSFADLDAARKHAKGCRK